MVSPYRDTIQEDYEQIGQLGNKCELPIGTI